MPTEWYVGDQLVVAAEKNREKIPDTHKLSRVSCRQTNRFLGFGMGSVCTDKPQGVISNSMRLV